MNKSFREEEEFNVWPTYSDVTFAVVLILIFIMLGQYVVIGKMLEIQKVVKEQTLLSNMLKQTFPDAYGKTINDTTQPQLQKITFSNRVLFDVGSDELKPEGKEILKGVAEILNKLRERRAFDEIQVRGHTDDTPIGRSIRKRFSTNWELSSARATSVVRFFVDMCRIIPSKELLLSAQGYSQYDYVKKNSTAENRAMNRRIEIIIKYPLTL